MKKLLFILLLIPSFIFAQDIIKKKDGETIECDILKVGDMLIKYKINEWEIYHINKSNVEYIQYDKEKTKILLNKNEDYQFNSNKEKNNEVLKKFNAAMVLKKKGEILLGVGIPCAAVGGLLVSLANTKTGLTTYLIEEPENRYALDCIGAPMVATAPFLITFGVIYLATANIRLNDCEYGITLYKDIHTSLNMAYIGNGIGLKLKF